MRGVDARRTRSGAAWRRPWSGAVRDDSGAAAVDDSGAAAVEFALVSVVLLTLFFGIVQYGMAFFQMQAASHAAREGARLAAVGVTTCAEFRTIVKERGGPMANIQRVGLDFNPGAVPGASAEVAVIWAPRKFGFPFVPFLTNSEMTATGTSRVESVGAVTVDCAPA